MLKELLEKIKTLSRTQTPFDVSRFNDPIAEKTQWSPAKGGGANFKTHNLVNVNYARIEFRSSVGAKLFYLVFLLVGLGVMVGISVSKISDGTFGLNLETLLMLAFGLVFASVGGGLIKRRAIIGRAESLRARYLTKAPSNILQNLRMFMPYN